MTELDKHIEILLLENDCVIVPDLGGFMAHYVEASYDDAEHLYLPPQRTLGFNPKLTMNDSLLAQSYVESYDISYPEAVSRIEREVVEIKQQIENQGSYELFDIGTLRLNGEGNYEFDPCQAGILTPSLYGLSALEIGTVGRLLPEADDEKPAAVPLAEAAERAVHIKMNTLRRVAAAAAAVLVLLVLTLPVGSESKSIIEKCMIDTDLFYRIMPKEITTNQPATVSHHKAQPKPAAQPAQAKPAAAPNPPQQPEAEAQAKAEAEPEAQPEVKPEAADAEADANRWIIVLASQVARKNAEDFVGRLHQRGYADARVAQRGKGVKVVMGSFASEGEAQERLRALRSESADFAEAWVMHL